MKSLATLMLSLVLAAGINAACAAQTSIVGDDSGPGYRLPISFPQNAVRTDKSAYNPGETVQFLVALSPITDPFVRTSRPAPVELSVSLLDPSGNLVRQFEINTDEFEPDVYSGAIPLAADAEPGLYTLRVDSTYGEAETGFTVTDLQDTAPQPPPVPSPEDPAPPAYDGPITVDCAGQ